MNQQIVKTFAEMTLCLIAFSIVVALIGCDKDTARTAAQQEAGTTQECLLTAQGEMCRTTNGISNSQNAD